MPKYTPGPWKQIEYDDWIYIGGNQMDFIEYDPINQPYNYHVKDAICVINHVDEMSEEDGENAHLIATTPELLEALEAILPWAAKAVADHYNQKAGKKALDKAYVIIARVNKETDQ